jgi:penicillin amidase
MHLLGPEHESWEALLEASIQELIRQWTFVGTIAERTWGRRNIVTPRHPLSQALPFLAESLDMESLPLAGDDNMPRVQGRAFGASERLAVSPSRQDASYLHMPGGQSGHFRSPHYRTQHEAWAEGRRTPFLPGPTEHLLTLEPAP